MRYTVDMKPEIEVKFLDVNHAVLRERLQNLGGECVQPVRLMRRKNFNQPDGSLEAKGGWVRVRDEGNKVTLAYKQLNNREVDGTHEVSVTVSSFAETAEILQRAGLQQTSYQETKRESWRLGDIEIELDEWPWVKPYIEIEGADKSSLKSISSQLGFDWNDAKYGSVEVVYAAEYDVTDEEIDTIPSITFSEPVPDWLEAKRR